MSDATETPPAEPNGNGTGEHGELYGILAEYDTPGELLEAARKVKDAGYSDFDCYSPFPVHGIDPAMGIKRTILPLVIFGGGFTGAVGGLLLQWYCNAYSWGWNISGKPTWSIPANIPIAYECGILLAVLTSFFGMWAFNKLPQVWHPLFRVDRFARVTDDGFFLGIEAVDKRFDAEKTKALLEGAGSIALENVYLDPDPAQKRMPKWLMGIIVASTAFALVPFAIAAKARNSKSSEPHIYIFPDMNWQPKLKSDAPDDLFPDGRANRGEITNTVARGWLEDDTLFFHGIEHADGADAWTTGFPKLYPDTPTLAPTCAVSRSRSTCACSSAARTASIFTARRATATTATAKAWCRHACERAAATGTRETSSIRRASWSRCRTASSSTRSRMATRR